MELYKKEYKQQLADHISVSIDDLLPNEASLIDKAYQIFNDRLQDIKALNDDIKRLNIELANLKAMTTPINEKQTYTCQICGHEQ